MRRRSFRSSLNAPPTSGRATHGDEVRFVAAGALMLAVAMGVGRFAYTPILPIMERDAGLSVAGAGFLASANLFGYLVGASLAMHPLTHRRRLGIMRWSIAGVVVTTALMASTAPLWLPLRFLTGVCSGFVLVFASSIMLERAAHRRKTSWLPLFFSGVGAGIAFSGLAVPVLVGYGGSRAAWLGMAAVSAVALLIAGRWFVDDAAPASVAEAESDSRLPRQRASFAWLVTVYTAEAFAYIIPATFLVAIVTRIPALSAYAWLSWVFVGLAGILTAFPWIGAAARLGKPRALGAALGIQAIGIAAPVFWRNVPAVIFSAVALGGTFMAITLFATALGRDLFPRATNAALSRLTAFYGVGQIVGPLVATQLAVRFNSYDAAVLAAAIVAGIAAAVTFVMVHEPQELEQTAPRDGRRRARSSAP